MRWPETAEALMRSRYEAYREGDTAWLLATWHPSTRPAVLDLSDNPRWHSLQVLEVVDGGPDDEHGTVEFRATYRLPTLGFGVLHERSRFVRHLGRWTYLDAEGEVEAPPT